jgi:DNA-binding transcriptional LysR family regulator
MTDFQITCFLYLVTYKSFTLAARQLGISQPALSHQIAALEKGLGIPLIERTHTGIILTPEGRVMYSTFLDAKRRIDDGLRQARTVHEKDQNLVYIGCSQDWRMEGFMNSLVEKCQVFQDLFQVEILQLGSRDLYQAMEEDSVDLIVDHQFHAVDEERYQNKPLADIHNFIMYPPTLPGGDLADFSNQPFIVISQALPDQELLDALEERLAFPLKNTVIVNSAESQYLSVKCGLGVALISEFSRNFSHPDMNYVDTERISKVLAIFKKESTNPYLNMVITTISH